MKYSGGYPVQEIQTFAAKILKEDTGCVMVQQSAQVGAEQLTGRIWYIVYLHICKSQSMDTQQKAKWQSGEVTFNTQGQNSVQKYIKALWL